MTKNAPSEALVEAMARAIATSRGSDIVQWHHRNDAQAAATVNAEAMAAKDAQLAELRAEIEALRGHIAEQITHAETRIQDGISMGATVWRIALEDVARENRAALGSAEG